MVPEISKTNQMGPSAAGILDRSNNRSFLTTKKQLLEKGILVRDGSSYKLFEWVRLCARPKEKVDILLAALKEACHVG